MNRIAFVAGAAVGYVLGTRAGKQRYEQLKGRAQQLWENPAVQDKVGTVTTRVTDTIKEQAPVLAEKVGATARSATGAVRDRVGGEDLPESLHRGTDGRLHADTSGFGPGGDNLP